MSRPGNKRRNGGDEMSARDKKKQKINAARTISVQPVPMAHGSGSGIVTGMFCFNSLTSI
jgi:ribonuclease P/MRP protein subunit POP1